MHPDLNKISMMLNLNIEALTILSSLYVRNYKDAVGTQLINISSCGGYTIVPTAVTYCAEKCCSHMRVGYRMKSEKL